MKLDQKIRSIRACQSIRCSLKHEPLRTFYIDFDEIGHAHLRDEKVKGVCCDQVVVQFACSVTVRKYAAHSPIVISSFKKINYSLRTGDCFWHYRHESAELIEPNICLKLSSRELRRFECKYLCSR